MASNLDIEMRWTDAWDDLCELLADRPDAACRLPDGEVVDVERCKRWLQESAYDGYHVEVEAGWVGLHRGIVVHRWRPADA